MADPERLPEGAKPPQHHVELQLLNILDQLRDAFMLAIECAERDIRRLMREKK